MTSNLTTLGPRSSIAFLGALLLWLTSCASPPEVPIARLYNDAAKREARNPVVVIHGILGARLQERASGKVVWGAFTGDAVDPETPEGARALAVPRPGSPEAAAYSPETAAVFASGPLDALDLDLFFGIVELDVYSNILKSLGVGGFRDPAVLYKGDLPEYRKDHFTCHTFFYDWRRDNGENAQALGRFLREKRAEIEGTARKQIEGLRAAGGTAELAEADELEKWLADGWKFDLVCHSMGGLVGRYYLRYGEQGLPADGSEPVLDWRGAEQVDRLMLVGTPSLGSIQALERLTRGFRPVFFLPRYHPAVLGTMPAIYQLLPRNEHQPLTNPEDQPLEEDLFDVALWDRGGWGLLDPASTEYLEWLLPEVSDAGERRAMARRWVADNLMLAQRFHRALDRMPDSPCPAEIRLFASGVEDTPGHARVCEREGDRLAVEIGPDVGTLPGDGVVPRYSALADLRHMGEESTWLRSPVPWSSVCFLPDDHIGLTSNPLFTDNLLFLLLEQRPRRIAGR